MNQLKFLLSASVLTALLAFAGSASADPPDFVGERGGGSRFDSGNGPPFGNGNGRGPRRGEQDEEEEEEENDHPGRGPDGNGPPGLCRGDDEGPEGQAGRSHIAHLNFFPRDPETGDRIEDGPWGRMMYTWKGPEFRFVFNAHELEPEGEWTLTYQPEPTPSPGVVCLGNGVVNDEGDLHIKNSVELNGNLPMPDDESEEGALLVLVNSADVDCELGEMLSFLPEEYLFGDALIKYVDTDLEEEEEEPEPEPETES